jgi:glycosyltransferase involved in cell wall biosynthesis
MTRNSALGSDGRGILLIGPQAPPYGGMALQAGLMHELMTGEGLSVTFLPSNPPLPERLHFLARLPGLRTFLRSVVFSWRVWRALARVELVHILACSWLYFFFVVCPVVLIGRMRRKRVIMTYHGGEAEEFLNRYDFLCKPFFRMAHVITAPSAFLASVISKQIGVPVRIVPNVVLFGAFPYRERNPLKPRMLVTRHLEKLYDVESVIRAFRQVQIRYPEASLWIVGTGEQEGRLRNLVATWDLKNVVFHGYVPYENMPALYEQCDILLNASRADNFPGSLAEASASGLVVISTGVGGIPYMFENGKSALLVQAGDWAGLASGVLCVLETPDLAARLAQAALEQCRQYDWTNVRRSLYAIYGFDFLPSDSAGLPNGATSQAEFCVPAGQKRPA